MKTLFLVLVLVGFGAVAQERPQIEPGPVVTLGDEAIAATDAVAHAKAKDLNEFRKTGNAVTEVTRQNTEPGVTRWRFTRKQCETFGIRGSQCLGGGILTVTIKNIEVGSGIRNEYSSTFVLLRSGPPR